MTSELVKYLDENTTRLIMEHWPGPKLELPRPTFVRPAALPRMPVRPEPMPECFSFSVTRYVAPITCTEEELRSTPPLDLAWHIGRWP